MCFFCVFCYLIAPPRTKKAPKGGCNLVKRRWRLVNATRLYLPERGVWNTQWEWRLPRFERRLKVVWGAESTQVAPPRTKKAPKGAWFLVAAVGLEPTTFRVWTECYSQLSYAATQIVREYSITKSDTMSRVFWMFKKILKGYWNHYLYLV